jgi:hypothetical protein
MKLRTVCGALVLAASLAACGSGGPARKVHPSTASIQQLSVQPDGSWRVALRVQNYSTFPMHYGRIEAVISVEGREAGTLVASADMDILGNSGDVVEATLRPSAPLAPRRDFAYQLKGTIETTEPRERFEFDRSSRLSPVPGVDATWR